MDTITAYTKPACVQCNATFRALDREENRLHRRRASPRILRLMRHMDSGEYLQAPVVVADDDHWSGFRPDRIRALVNQEVQAAS
jgi:glutaredoxin-like protein NrdH